MMTPIHYWPKRTTYVFPGMCDRILTLTYFVFRFIPLFFLRSINAKCTKCTFSTVANHCTISLFLKPVGPTGRCTSRGCTSCWQGLATALSPRINWNELRAPPSCKTYGRQQHLWWNFPNAYHCYDPFLYESVWMYSCKPLPSWPFMWV